MIFQKLKKKNQEIRTAPFVPPLVPTFGELSGFFEEPLQPDKVRRLIGGEAVNRGKVVRRNNIIFISSLGISPTCISKNRFLGP